MRTISKERLSLNTAAAACNAEASCACADTSAQARALFSKGTMLRMVSFIFMSLYFMIHRLIYRMVRYLESNGKRSAMVSAPRPAPSMG